MCVCVCVCIARDGGARTGLCVTGLHSFVGPRSTRGDRRQLGERVEPGKQLTILMNTAETAFTVWDMDAGSVLAILLAINAVLGK